MAEGQQIILQIKHTTCTICQPTNLCISSVCTEDKDSIQKRCSLQIKKASSISIPTSIAPNVWIITSPTTAVPSGITLICPGEATRSITSQTTIHVLLTTITAYSATSQHFHLPPCYESHDITINISLNIANLNVINISAPEFRIWQTPRRLLELNLTSSLGQYTISTH